MHTNIPARRSIDKEYLVRVVQSRETHIGKASVNREQVEHRQPLVLAYQTCQAKASYR